MSSPFFKASRLRNCLILREISVIVDNILQIGINRNISNRVSA